MHGLIFVTWEKYLVERFGSALLYQYRQEIGETAASAPLASQVYDDATLLAGVCKIRVETQQESGLKSSITEVYSTVSKTLWRQRGCYVTWNGQPFTT